MRQKKVRLAPPEHFEVGDTVWLAWAYKNQYNHGIRKIVLTRRTPCKWEFKYATDVSTNCVWHLDDSCNDRKICRTEQEAALYVLQVLKRRYDAAKEVWKRRHEELNTWHEEHFKET